MWSIKLAIFLIYLIIATFCCELCFTVFTRPCQEARDISGRRAGLEKLYRTVLNWLAKTAFTAWLASEPNKIGYLASWMH